MKKIRIFDTTLRDGEQSPGCSMSIKEKVEIAKKLNEMKVDVIEAGFAASNERDKQAIKEISKECDYSVITSLARCNKEDIFKAAEAIKEAKHKRIHLFIATSAIHMKYKLRKTPEEVLYIIKDCVTYAKTLCDDIEFSLEDATRSDKDFACKVIDTAIKCGATVINIPDTVGYMTPFEFRDFINYLKEHSRIDDVQISVHCHNDIGLATANSLAAIECGIDQIECTVNGIGERAGNTSLEEIVAALMVKKDILKAKTNIKAKYIKEISDMVVQFTGSLIQRNKAIVGENAFKHEAGIHQAGVIKNASTYEIMKPEDFGIENEGIVIGIHSGRSAIIQKMEKMGYEVENYNVDKIVEDLKTFFEKSKILVDEDFIKILNNNVNKKNNICYA